MRIAILVLSDAGLALGRSIRDAGIGEVAIFGPGCVVGRCGPAPPGANPKVFPTDEPGVFGWIGPLRLAVPEIWDSHDAIVAIMALGIVVRLIAPLAKEKRSDPAVVAVDEAGRFVISVLGGHGGGANALTRTVADRIAATAVITTASEALGLPGVDQIGREFGWKVERTENLTRVAAVVVRRRPIVVYQDAGDSNWWSKFGPWPDHFERLAMLGEWPNAGPAALLVITDRTEPSGLPADRTLVYRPPTLVAGIGCKRGTTREVIDSFVTGAFADHGLAIASLARVATVSLKADEPGLIEFAGSRGVPLVDFTAQDLANQPGIERPSERVRSKIGIASVAEAAALRSSGSKTLLVPKQKGPGVTVAIARIEGLHQT